MVMDQPVAFSTGAVDEFPDARPRNGPWAWLDERLGVSAVSYPVPAHANSLWYTLGGITVIGFLVLILTGIYLAQFYHPHPADARESVLYIQNAAPLGDIVRGLHVWLASLVTITALLHLGRVFLTASYKRPREINWLVGVALLAVTLGFVFTGSVLRWDQEAWEALQHNTEAALLLGNLGTWFTPQFAANVPILERLYLTHISLLPTLLFILLALHFLLVKKHGISARPATADAGEAPRGILPTERLDGRYSDHLRKMAGYGLVLVALAGILAVLFPPAIGEVANPTLEVTKPAWVFYWLYAFEGPLGVRGILYAAVIFFGLLLLVPFVDFTPWRSPARRRAMLAVAALVVVAVAALSLYVWLTPTQEHLEEARLLLGRM
jgi:quinol-cytochrome oxidoreductase complex cytochrome b subunit